MEAPKQEQIFDGLSLASSNLVTALTTTRPKCKYGFQLNSTVSLSANYFVNGAASDHVLSFSHPTDAVTAAMNEIMFRIAVSATNASLLLVGIPAQQTSVKNIYQSHYAYFGAALVVIFVTAFSILSTFWGWWSLGRPVSLNPLEIAKAFNGPLFVVPRTSNATLKELLAAFGDIRVQYGEVVSNDREASGDVSVSRSRQELAKSRQWFRLNMGSLSTCETSLSKVAGYGGSCYYFALLPSILKITLNVSVRVSNSQSCRSKAHFVSSEPHAQEIVVSVGASSREDAASLQIAFPDSLERDVDEAMETWEHQIGGK